MDPTSAESTRPPDPPNLQRFRQYTPGDRSTPPQNTLSNRLTKLTFPAFDGTEFRDWICRCEQFFDIDNTAPELKVRLAAMHMIGKALQWHMNYLAEQFGIFPSWTNYIIALSGRFNGLFDDPLADLVALKQGTDSVPEYLEKFENARTRLSLPEAHALSIFLTNMNPHLSLHVRQFGPTSLSDAARIASLHESSLAATPQRSYRAPFNPSQQQKNYGAPYKQQTPLLPAPELPKHTTKPTFIPKSNTDRPARKFSYQEMQDRRAKGLCMFCDEAFTPGHQLKHKRSQIFVMECEDEDDDEDPLLENEKITDLTDEEAQAEPTPVISVNALSGSTTFNCMRVIGKYGK